MIPIRINNTRNIVSINPLYVAAIVFNVKTADVHLSIGTVYTTPLEDAELLEEAVQVALTITPESVAEAAQARRGASQG